MQSTQTEYCCSKLYFQNWVYMMQHHKGMGKLKWMESVYMRKSSPQFPFNHNNYDHFISIYINLRRSHECLRSCVRSFVWSSLDSIHSVRFGQLLRCAHKRIVKIMKVYMERKNRQLELMRFHKNIAFIHVYFF